MISDLIKNHQRYSACHPEFDRVFKELVKFNNLNFGSQKIELEHSGAFLLFYSGKGQAPSAVKLECHNKYIDIHYVIEGEDLIGYKPRQNCLQMVTDKLSEDDYILFSDPSDCILPLHEGQFAIYFPEDAHAPLLGEMNVKKIVAKIPV